MQVPGVLVALQDQGVIDRVVRPLKSGKEAEVFLVESEGELRVAKVYKSMHRSFKQRSMYTEGRKVRNTRDQRAIDRRTRHGKKQEEDAWKSAEVDIIHRLHAAGVRVPTPYNFIDGVLIMELVTDADGDVAPRLAEVSLDRETANAYYQQLLKEVVRMLCAGVIHGDLSDYNILVDAEGPVVIDFPQAVDAAANRNAKKLLLRDVDNLGNFLERVVPGTRLRPYGQEIWAAFENNHLSVDMKLTGDFRRSSKKTNVTDVLGLIGEADEDERVRRGEAPRRRRGGAPREGRVSKERKAKDSAPEKRASEASKSEDAPTTPRYRRMQVVETAAPSSQKKSGKRGGSKRGESKRGDSKRGQRRSDGRRGEGRRSEKGADGRHGEERKRPEAGESADGAPPAKRRRRRRRRGNGEGRSSEGATQAARTAQGSSSSKSESEPRRREGRGERRRSGPAQGSEPRAGGPESREAGTGDAPRRRRRRRRGPPKPSSS
ncbi:MAG: PA4780 family RIO1-like protein kinase [Polyangiales bacterium]